jgi:hypothetical protein
LYDQGSELALLCPLINLVVSLVKGYLRANKYKYSQKLLEFDIPKSQSGIREVQGVKIANDFTVGDAFKIIAFRYSASNASLPSHVRTSKSNIYAFEFADIMGNNDDFFARKLSIKGKRGVESWQLLVPYIDVVFCRDFGTIVHLQSIPKLICAREVPPGHDILICTGSSLRKIFDRVEHKSHQHSGRSNFNWYVTGRPYECVTTMLKLKCEGKNCWRSRLQSITSGAWFGRQKDPVITGEPMEVMDDGAICFGQLEEGFDEMDGVVEN